MPADPSPARRAWRVLAERRWQVAAFLAVAAALNYADRAAISAVFPALRRDFALTDVELGLLGSVFLWCYALGSPFAGLACDRWPRHRVLVASLVAWSLVTCALGFAGGLLALVMLRGLLGLAESLYLPAATALLAGHHGRATRGQAMGLHSVGLNGGVVLGGAVAGTLADHAGWRAGFWVLGGLGVALALIAPRFLAPAPDEPPTPTAPARPAEAWRYLRTTPSYHALLAKAMLAGVGVWIFLHWLPLYLRETFALSLGEAGFAGTFMLQASTVGGIVVGGWLSDRVARAGGQRRMQLQAWAYLLAAPLLLLFLVRPAWGVVIAAVAGFSFLRGVGQASENPALCEVVPPRFRSTAIGLMNTGATAAGGAGVLLAGLLKGGWGLGAVFAGISLLFAAAGLLLLVAARRWMPGDLARAEARDS